MTALVSSRPGVDELKTVIMFMSVTSRCMTPAIDTAVGNLYILLLSWCVLGLLQAMYCTSVR